MMLWSLYREPIGKRRDSCMETIFEPPTLPFHSKLRITVRSQAYVLGLGLGLEGRGLGLGLEGRGLGLGLGLRILALTTSLRVRFVIVFTSWWVAWFCRCHLQAGTYVTVTGLRRVRREPKSRTKHAIISV